MTRIDRRKRARFATLGLLAALGVAGCASPDQREALINFFFDRAVRRTIATTATLGSQATTTHATPLKHAPYAKGECNRCHGSGNSLVEISSKSDPEALAFNFTAVDPSSFKNAKSKCLSCHSNASEVGASGVVAPANMWVHGPVANVECVRCHDAHESPRPHLLKADRLESICTKCHEDQPRTLAMKKLDCVECHDPHKASSPGAMFLAENAKGDLCVKCHDKVGKDPSKPWVHAPVVAGECSRCHSTHSGDEHAVRRPLRNACVACHDSQSLQSRPEHAPEKGDCDKCHDPHASSSAGDHFLRVR